MLGFREYQKKLAALRNMQRITRTMKMIATTKLARSQVALIKARAFYQSFAALVQDAAGAADPAAHHELFAARPPSGYALIVLFTSDMGLCGAFNQQVIRAAAREAAALRARGLALRMSFCGRRGYHAFKHQFEVRSFHENATRAPSWAEALQIGDGIFDAFREGGYDEVRLAYNRFVTPLQQVPQAEVLLPLAPPAPQPGAAAAAVCEPSGAELLAQLVRNMVRLKIHEALLHNAAGEHGARMTAMDTATTNIDHLRTTYTLLKNRARQASITNELTEIVASKEAME